MLPPTQNHPAAVEFHFRWQSPEGVHTECYHADRINFWRDLFPAELLRALLGKASGECFSVAFAAGTLTPPYATGQLQSLKRLQVNARMLEDLKIWPLLRGYRGKPPVDLDRLIEAMIRLSYLAADFPEILELDINPLLAGPGGILAVDARIVVDPDVKADPAEPYAHLALHPYPEEYVSAGVEMDGHTIVFRPIKPEDEARWMEMLGSCSRESI